MPELLSKNAKLVQPPIDCLVSSSDFGLSSFVSCRKEVSRHSAFERQATIGAIDLNHFICIKHMPKLVLEYPLVRPLASWKRPISPHNVTGLDTHSYFIPDSRTFKLVAVPFGIYCEPSSFSIKDHFSFAELWLVDAVVSAIHCGKTGSSLVIPISVGPLNLQRREK